MYDVSHTSSDSKKINWATPSFAYIFAGNEVVFEKNENNEIIQSISKLVNRAPREYIESKIGPENINKIINKPYNWVINLD